MIRIFPEAPLLHPNAGGPGRTPDFLFATGIEKSDPVVTGQDGEDVRVDSMQRSGHYRRWREDFQLVQDLGLRVLRYGPAYHRTHLGPGRYDWSFADDTFHELDRLGIVPIADLCHFGVPDWLGDFQNPEFPQFFAEYAAAFAERYPKVRMFTPVNEIFITALFSAQFGWWNERLESDQGFVTALKHLCKANVLAQHEIMDRRERPIFVQSESTEYYHPTTAEAERWADFHNQKRFLSLDLNYGRDVHACMYRYLTAHGMTEDEYLWFLEHGLRVKSHCVMGNDYYPQNERFVDEDGVLSEAGEIYGYYVITKQYFDRYHLPVMHTETNLDQNLDSVRWLVKQWHNLLRLKQDGVPIIGFTWYSLLDQVDWDSSLREANGRVNPRGLYDLDRKIRPVGEKYRELVAEWKELMPYESLCLGHLCAEDESCAR